MKTKPSPAVRTEGFMRLLIVLVVGGFAGAASFTHVHDWTLNNSPDGTGDWFGWANAVISELVPIACLLTIRQRKRDGGTFGYPMFLLIAAAGFSLTAQLAIAKPGIAGAVVAAFPAVAFMALVKLVLAPQKDKTPTTDPVQKTEPAWLTTPAAEPAHPIPAPPAYLPPTAPAPVQPDSIPATEPAATIEPTTTPVVTVEPAPVPVATTEPAPVPAGLIAMARMAQTNYHATIGGIIPSGVLAARLNITHDVAEQLLQHLEAVHTGGRAVASRINGTPVSVGA
jgi:hypothetical protein